MLYSDRLRVHTVGFLTDNWIGKDEGKLFGFSPLAPNDILERRGGSEKLGTAV